MGVGEERGEEDKKRSWGFSNKQHLVLHVLQAHTANYSYLESCKIRNYIIGEFVLHDNVASLASVSTSGSASLALVKCNVSSLGCQLGVAFARHSATFTDYCYHSSPHRHSEDYGACCERRR